MGYPRGSAVGECPRGGMTGGGVGVTIWDKPGGKRTDPNMLAICWRTKC